jgi:hypothetical protein
MNATPGMLAHRSSGARKPALAASFSEQNQRSPFFSSIRVRSWKRSPQGVW